MPFPICVYRLMFFTIILATALFLMGFVVVLAVISVLFDVYFLGGFRLAVVLITVVAVSVAVLTVIFTSPIAVLSGVFAVPITVLTGVFAVPVAVLSGIFAVPVIALCPVG